MSPTAMLPRAARPRPTTTVPPDGAFDRATAALDGLSGELATWLAAELVRLAGAREDWRRSPSPAAASALKLCAHDLKGLAGTCGFPLAGRMAGSLERLLETAGSKPNLVEAHVDAVLAVVREAARRADHPLGLRLAQALEAAAGVTPSRPA